MARWRPLPVEVRPEVRRLVERLRLLKDRTGLSLAALARKTASSASSWQRYLSGAAFPPWEAVAALGELAGLDEPARVRLRVLWESAAEAWAREGGEPGTPGTPPLAGPVSAAGPVSTAVLTPGGPAGPAGHAERAGHARRAGRAGWAGWAGTGALRWTVAVLVLLLLATVPGSEGKPAGRPAWPWPVPPEMTGEYPARAAPRCTGARCQGRDPVRTGCAKDGQALGRYDTRQHRVEVFHSAACRAVWGQVTPADGVEGLSLSTRGSGQLWADAGTERTRMAAVGAEVGANVQVCAVLEGHQSCVDSGDRAWTD
ncbi:helix-turn-helix domain-containing protein [Streptomyces daliensis]